MSGSDRDDADDGSDPGRGPETGEGPDPTERDGADRDDGGRERGPWADAGRTYLRRLVDASAAERVALSVVALVLSVLVGGVVVFAAGVAATCQSAAVTVGGVGVCYDPIQVYKYLFLGAFTNPSQVSVWPPQLLLDTFSTALTLRQTTLLIFTGLAVAVSFRAGMFNIGTQGQLVLGGLASAMAVIWTAPVLPSGGVAGAVLVVVGLLAGAAVGAFWAAIPGALKAYADANEVITTIMLNFVATNFAFFLVSSYFKDPDSPSIKTVNLPEYAQIRSVVPVFGQSSFALMVLVFALLLVAGGYYLLRGTAYGFDLRTGGVQPAAAEYAGVDSEAIQVSSMAISGAIGGLGGAVWVMMVMGHWRVGVPALGFDGITVSILAGNNPLGVPLAAFLFGILKSGSLAIQSLGVPQQLVGVLRGLIILFIAMPEFLRMLGRRYGVGASRRVATDGGTVDGGTAASADGSPPTESDDAASGGDGP